MANTIAIHRATIAAPRTVSAPRWAIWAATAAALAPLPSGLWRIAGACGVPLGFSDDVLGDLSLGSRESLYMIALSVFAEALGFLALGLVRNWGELFPRWIPVAGGRRVPISAAVVPAALGALVLTMLGVFGIFGWNNADNMGHPDAPNGVAYWVMTLCYSPLVLWGPMLAIATIGYYARRTRTTVKAGRHQARVDGTSI
ncbi:MAG: hypothetical protein HOQ05_12275 [Corynebacteriales bacterium]|nr:hypothetical protein [Mycobacteriales bacterium]